MPVVKKFGKDFKSPGGALTLNVFDVSDQHQTSGTHTKTHDDNPRNTQ